MSETLQAGFALAATIAHDPGAKLAEGGLAGEASAGWCGLARELEQLSKAERRERIRRLARGKPLDLSDQGARAPRALALLARPGARGTSLAEAVLPRPGYVPEPALLSLLSRIARRPPER